MMIVACPMISSCKKTHPLVLIIIVVLVLSSSLSSSSSLSFRHLDSFNAFRHPISTSISLTITITAAATRNRRTQMSATTASGSSSIDNDIAQWVSDAGYGQVKSSSRSGSSDWASFRKVEVTNPPTPETSFFVKVSQRSAKDMFEGEALGLQAMYECSNTGRNTSDNNHDDDNDKNESLCIPKVFHWGDSSSSSSGSFLIMEYLVLKGRSNEYALGRAMAKMHLADPTTVPKAGNLNGKFGFNVDNTIGGTVQPNPWTDNNTTQDWIDFYSTHRIQHQLQLAGDASLLRMWTNDIAPRLPMLFENLEVKPSLLHGDLWSGNIGSAKNGIPSIYDPAVYWGHHEAEWGMSWCASLGPQFWDGYRSLIPEDPGFRDRKPLYDAYHQLNHYNLFGGGYLSTGASQLTQVKKILDKK